MRELSDKPKREEGHEMTGEEKGSMIDVEEVCEQLKVSRSYAYRVIRRLNSDLKEQGILTIPGKVNSAYLEERYFATETPEARKGHAGTQDGGEDDGGLQGC